MSKISAVIITLNEEENIMRCLNSLQGVADEIVVVDSFSTDNTPSICKQHPNTRFFQRDWEGYAKTKNRANEQASHPYILSIDADEVLDKELRDSIITLKKNGLSGAYQLNRMTNYCGKWIKHSGWYPDRKIRLFKKGKARWSGDLVHEKLIVDASEPIHLLSGHLLHYSINSIDQHKQVIAKYAALKAQASIYNGRNASVAGIYLSAIVKFIEVYLFKLGVLDGKYGWHIARLSAKAKIIEFQKRMALRQQQKQTTL
jgi:glycosyltransferase involved in cell wall biosynthesis